MFRQWTTLLITVAAQGCTSVDSDPTQALITPSFAVSRNALQYAGLVLKKLDTSQPPSYPNEFFTPSPDGVAPSGREILTNDVADAVRIMADPLSMATEYCSPIHNILTLAVGTNTYFDISRTSNPALEDFRRDWEKVKSFAGC